MRSYETRKDKLTEKIDDFLIDETIETLSVRLYGREIKSLPRSYPTIDIEVGAQYMNSDLWECVISKK